MKKNILISPKGMMDVLPDESYKWQYIEAIARATAALFGANEIRTPILESSILFSKGIGENTDIVSKEMYTLKDKSNRMLTLKPEGTAPVVRSYIENGLFNEPKPIKLFYISPFFRYEKPQKGRFRQFNQFGVEYFGTNDIKADVEIVDLATTFLHRLGLEKLSVKINYIGSISDRKNYSLELKKYFMNKTENLCDICKQRVTSNVLRVLDCKACSNLDEIKCAPSILNFLSNKSLENFNLIKDLLNKINIDFIVDDKIIRGLDYYSGLVFEIEYNNIVGPSKVICGGGRYDSLIENLGGKSTGAVGFAIGLERLLQEDLDISIPDQNTLDIYLLDRSNSDYGKVIIAKMIRESGFSCLSDISSRSENAQFKYALKNKAKYIIYIDSYSEDDIKVSYRRLEEENDINIDKLITNIKNNKKSKDRIL